jgi:hypothetical protein
MYAQKMTFLIFLAEDTQANLRCGGAAQRILEADKPTKIIHLGDHDPSGIDMTRDIQERLNMFTGTEGGFVQVKRIALNYDQIELYRPPANPAKNTDSRFQDYYKKFGGECWELDALEPSVIVNLIQNTINEYTDQYEYEEQQNIENSHKDQLRKFLEEK